MQTIDRYFILLIELVVFTIISFFSMDFANGLCLVVVFLSALSSKINLELSDLCVFSIFADICAYRFIGISFATYSAVYIITLRGKNYLKNKPIKEKIYYFLVSIIAVKSFVFMLVVFFRGKFDFTVHLLQLVWAVSILCVYYASCGLWKKIRYAIYKS